MRERLLFLNTELHDKRFYNRDLTVIVQLWESARDLYNARRFDEAQVLIDQAFTMLYGGQSGGVPGIPGQQDQMMAMVEPDPTNGRPGNMDTSGKRKEMQEMPVYVSVEQDTSMKIFDAVSGFISSFTEICWFVLAKPSFVFEVIKKKFPLHDLMLVLAVLGFISTLSFILSFELGIWSNLLVIVMSPIYGIVIGGIGAVSMYLTLSIFNVKAKIDKLACIFGFSLIPYLLIIVVFTLLRIFLPILSEYSVLELLIYSIFSLVFMAWSMHLQVKGLGMLYGLEGMKAFNVVIIVNLLIFSILFTLGWFQIASEVWGFEINL